MSSSTLTDKKISHYYLATEEETSALAKNFAKQCRPGMVIYLQGELGAGKTSFTRGLLQGLGYIGRVKSPTFTMVESYQLANFNVYHFDLYRLNHPEELHHLGFTDYISADSLMIIEWPEKAQTELPAAHFKLCFQIPENGEGRELQITYMNSSPKKNLK